MKVSVSYLILAIDGFDSCVSSYFIVIVIIMTFIILFFLLNAIVEIAVVKLFSLLECISPSKTVLHCFTLTHTKEPDTCRREFEEIP